ncbi:cupin, partial [Mesorhizobium sp. M7A.F.Ca.US.001.01.1.1]
MKIAADHALNDNAATSAEARRSTVLG